MKNLGKSFYTRYKDYLPALGAIIALGVISTILIDGFMNVNSIGAILLRSSVLAMVAMGVTFVVIAGDSGLDLSTGALMVVGAMIGPNLRVGGEESLILSFLLVFVVGAAIGCINGLGVYFLKIPALVMTMAMNGLVAGYCIMLTHSQLTVNIPKSLADLNTVAFGPIRKMTLLIIILMILLQLFLTKSKIVEKTQFLGSQNNTVFFCFMRRGKVDFLSVNGNLSCVFGNNAADGLCQGALTRTIAAQDRADLTMLAGDRGILQRNDRAIVFNDRLTA